MNIEDFLQTHTNDFIRIRRELHQCAELSTLEYETGTFIRNYLEQWGIPYDYPVAETGIVAEIHGNAPVDNSPESLSPKTVALRADMDALPIYEDPCNSYCSKNPGVMHACGHDAHMAIALGAARFFQENKNDFTGCVKIFFQPAEETIGGARRMIEEGCMERPKVDYVIGLHVAPYLQTGTIEVKYGKLYAASDEVSITLKGKGCHGAYPDTGVDAIVLAAQLISALQTIVSRNVSPTDPCVLSLGTIHGGTARNILADTVELTGILRTTDPNSRTQIQELISQMAQTLPAAMGGQGKALFSPGYDALINTNALVDLLTDTAAPILGREHVLWKPAPGMGVEDFSHFLKKAPGVFYHLGCGNPEQGISAPLHSRNFSLDEDCIALGIRLQTAFTKTLLQREDLLSSR